MKQVDFIKILSSQLPETFKTEQLLLVLLESSNSTLALHEVRKCMHNHLYRLEQQNLVKRLCPKRTRNASFKRLFSFDSVNLSLIHSHSKLTEPVDSANYFHLFEQHAQKLKEEAGVLHKKRDIFKQLTENYKVYEPLITRKLSDLNSELRDKNIELEAIHELMSAINCLSTSATQRVPLKQN